MAGVYKDYYTNPVTALPFIPGTGTAVQFAQVGEILAHPVADKYFYISDNYGVRVMCTYSTYVVFVPASAYSYADGGAPPAPVLFYNPSPTSIIIQWNPQVPAVCITNYTLSVPSVGFSGVIAGSTLQQTISGLLPGSYHNVTIFASNEYGYSETSSLEIRAAGTEMVFSWMCVF